MEANANPSASVNTETINSLKLNTTAPVNSAINNGAHACFRRRAGSVRDGGFGCHQWRHAVGGDQCRSDPVAEQRREHPHYWFRDRGRYEQSGGGGIGADNVGQGKTLLTGNNTYTGPTYISAGYSEFPAGTLQVGNGGTSGSIATSSAVIDNGTLAFNRSDNTSVSGAISGSGGLTQAGTGALTLTANSTLSGLVTVSSGTLQLGNGGAAGSVSNALGMVLQMQLVFDTKTAGEFSETDWRLRRRDPIWKRERDRCDQ